MSRDGGSGGRGAGQPAKGGNTGGEVGDLKIFPEDRFSTATLKIRH